MKAEFAQGIIKRAGLIDRKQSKAILAAITSGMSRICPIFAAMIIGKFEIYSDSTRGLGPSGLKPRDREIFRFIS
jgi:hypothetical protein